jgi:hypothetical protein
MTIDAISDLTMKDVRFLMAVRDVNANPEQYEKTEPGVAAANTMSLGEATSLSKGEIRHRLNEKSDIAAEELGVVTLYEAPMTEKGYGPKSVALTEDGERFLEYALSARGIGGRDPGDVEMADRLSALEARVQELEMMRSEFIFTDDEATDDEAVMLGAHELLFQSLVGEPAGVYEDRVIDKDELVEKVLGRLREVNNG